MIAEMPNAIQSIKIFISIALTVLVALLVTWFVLIKTARDLRRGVHEDEYGEPIAFDPAASEAPPAATPEQPPSASPHP
ncbi:MAG: hypothetical protein ACTTJV_05250 [Ottowia sp.]